MPSIKPPERKNQCKNHLRWNPFDCRFLEPIRCKAIELQNHKPWQGIKEESKLRKQIKCLKVFVCRCCLLILVMTSHWTIVIASFVQWWYHLLCIHQNYARSSFLALEVVCMIFFRIQELNSFRKVVTDIYINTKLNMDLVEIKMHDLSSLNNAIVRFHIMNTL